MLLTSRDLHQALKHLKRLRHPRLLNLSMMAIVKWELPKLRRHQALVAADLEILTRADPLRLGLAVAQPELRAELVRRRLSLADVGEKLMKRHQPGKSLAKT